MITQVDIESMSREEKLRTMEALWQEISKEDPGLESPAWHGEILEQTRSRVSEGSERTMDWEEAKRRLSFKVDVSPPGQSVPKISSTGPTA